MSSKPDFIRKKYGPLREKTLRNELAPRIVKEFPRIGEIDMSIMRRYDT
jgi:hypothetical protein